MSIFFVNSYKAIKINMNNKKYWIFIGIVFLMLGCRKNGTNWTSDWVVPLINDSLMIKDYVNDSTLGVNPDQSIQVIAKRNLLNLDLASIIKIPDTSIEQSFNISVPSLNLSPGASFIDNIKEHEFTFDEATLLRARIKAGRVSIRIENPIPTKAIFTISLPGVTKDGGTLSKSKTVDGGTTSNPGIGEMVIDFSGYMIDMTGENGNSYNVIQSKMHVKSDPNGPSVTITDQDEFKTNVAFEGMVVDYGEGYFGTQVFSDTTVVNVTQLDHIVGGQININDLNLDLVIKNGIKVRGKGKITLFESVNKDNNTVSLNHPYFSQTLNINPAQGAWQSITPSELTFSFNNSSGNMKNFLENLGSKYRVGYSITLNPLGSINGGHDVLYPQSKLGIDLNADFPLRIGANDLILQDTFAIDFKNDKKLLTVQSGKLILKTTNSFPYGVTVHLELLDVNMNKIKELKTTGQISPATTNSNSDGHIPIEERSEFIVDEDAALLLTDTKYILVRATLNSNYWNNNIVYANAALKFVLSSQLKLKADL